MNKSIVTQLIAALSLSLTSTAFAAGGAKETGRDGKNIKGVTESRDKAQGKSGIPSGSRSASEIKEGMRGSLADALESAKSNKVFQGVEIGNAKEIAEKLQTPDLVRTLIEEGINSNKSENQEIASAVVLLNSREMTKDVALRDATSTVLIQALVKGGKIFETSTDAEFKKQRENILTLARKIKENKNLDEAIRKAAERRGMDLAAFIALLKECANRA